MVVPWAESRFPCPMLHRTRVSTPAAATASPMPHRYESGKYLNKKNTFTDFIAAAGV